MTEKTCSELAQCSLKVVTLKPDAQISRRGDSQAVVQAYPSKNNGQLFPAWIFDQHILCIQSTKQGYGCDYRESDNDLGAGNASGNS
jgi:hypothetical protein